jgi:hypothetical protein
VSAPALSRKTSKGQRYYTWAPQGSKITERYYSVTTIISGGLPKPALIGWAAKMTALAAIEDLDVVAKWVKKDLLEDGSLPPFGEKDGKPTSEGCIKAYELLTKARFKKSKKAADLGTAIHEAIEAWVTDKPIPAWPADVEPFMEQFLEFLDRYEPKFLASEAKVFNRTRRYAGQLDMIVELDTPVFQGTYIGDVKTGGVWPEAALQMAAYANAEFIAGPDGLEYEVPKVSGGFVLDLKRDRYDLIPVRIDQDIYQSFLYIRECFRFMEETSKTCIGAPVDWPRGVSA